MCFGCLTLNTDGIQTLDSSANLFAQFILFFLLSKEAQKLIIYVNVHE